MKEIEFPYFSPLSMFEDQFQLFTQQLESESDKF